MTVLFTLNLFLSLHERLPNMLVDCTLSWAMCCCFSLVARFHLFLACVVLNPCHVNLDGKSRMGQDFAEGLPHDVFDSYFGAAVRRVQCSSSEKQYFVK